MRLEGLGFTGFTDKKTSDEQQQQQQQIGAEGRLDRTVNAAPSIRAY